MPPSGKKKRKALAARTAWAILTVLMFEGKFNHHSVSEEPS
jgi:hypothetical protein